MSQSLAEPDEVRERLRCLPYPPRLPRRAQLRKAPTPLIMPIIAFSLPVEISIAASFAYPARAALVKTS
jgi:hypothetical protein